MEKQLEQIKEYIEEKFKCEFRYEIKQNDDNEEYIEIRIKLENNKQDVILRFEPCEMIKRDIKKQIHYILDDYCSKKPKI